jgi:gliding motility-associated-like protein
MFYYQFSETYSFFSSNLLFVKMIQYAQFFNRISYKNSFLRYTVFFSFSLLFFSARTQNFPNPASLSTGQGVIGTIDPLWQASPWFTTVPPNPIGLTYISTLINNNCAPGSWVDPSSLPAPVNNGNWITGSDDDCATNTNSGYRYFRLTLELPDDCNGFTVTAPNNYVLNLIGYADNSIVDVFINGNSTGITGGGFSLGSELIINLVGPWLVGTNYVDVLVYNFPSPSGANPYGLLLVADATATAGLDTDGDGVSNLDDLCPCDAGDNPYGCTDPSLYDCDIDAIRQAFIAAGCVEMPGCSSDCSIYFLNPTALTGADAQAFAQTLGANLVSLQSQSENDCVLTGLNNLNFGTNEVVWIGFSDDISEGSFVWYDQSPIVYTNWAVGEPNQSGDEDCVQIYPGGANPGTWNDLSCSSSNSMSIIEVNLCPLINAGADQVICIEETANLMASNTLFGSSPYSYTWNNGINVQANPVSPLFETEYIVTTVDRYGCTNSDSVVVSTRPIFSDTVSASICEGETFVFEGGDYTLDGDYLVSYQTISGCDSLKTLLLTVFPTPNQPVIISNSPVLCPDDLLIMSMGTEPGASYFWSGPNGYTSQSQEVSFPLNSSNSGNYTGYITLNGCPSPIAIDSAWFLGINLDNLSEFPNVITPNGDQNNDELDLDNYFTECIEYKLTITNRWGNLVFEQSQGTEPFGGKDVSGNELVDGVYFYSITFEDRQLNGFITIAR